jgi:F-box interacting protein
MPILERLPSKSLFRFRCVSKEFRSLFSDGFHLIYHRSQDSDHFTHYSLHHPETYDQYFRFELPSKIGKLLYVNSCLGACCLFGHPNVFVLWIPFIQKFLTLPKPSLPKSLLPDSIRGHYRYAHGLGVDRSSGYYKVVRLVYLMIVDDASVTLSSEAEVLNLNTLCWKRICGPTICASQTLSPAYVNGVIHWICLGALLLFDVIDEVFRTMKLPDGLTLRAIAACKGSLLACDYEYQRGICVVWVMLEYGVVESWIRHTVIYDPDWVIRGPLSFSSSGELLASTEVGELLFCDRRPRETKKLGDLYVDKCFGSLFG